MPKAQIPVGYAKVNVNGFYGPATWENVLYFQVETYDAAHFADVEAILTTALHSLYYDVWRTATNLDWSVQTYKVVFRDADDSVQRTTVADAIFGTISGAGQTAQTCYLIDWQSGDPRRGGKPRSYIPGVPDSKVVSTTNLDPTIVAAINTALDSWIGTLGTISSGTASGLVLVEMSFVNAKADRTTPLPYTIRKAVCSPQVATQRRRVDRLRA